ncbi:MAG: hypothetical protein M3Y79_14385 [Pseudomonadota bacterium]|nr:hypothetical protein [Pseudomonadota bacterium]
MVTAAEHMNGAASEAGARAEEALRRRATQLQKFFDDVEDLLGRVSSLDDSEISRLRSRVESSISHVRSAARDGVQATVDGAKSAAMATDEYVHRKPWMAIAATAVACLALGALLRGER